MVKLIHADGFFNGDDAQKYAQVVNGLKFTQKSYGHEIENFNMVLHGIEPVFSRVLAEKVFVDHKRSGVFRKPSQFIHFEDWHSLDEWCFVVALEKTNFNLWQHLSAGLGEHGVVDALSALDGYQFNYRNLLEWNIDTSITLNANQGVFFRPWMFHSLDEGRLVQYYRLIADRNVRVLIMGLPHSGKSRMAKKVQQMLPNSVWLDAHEQAVKAKDVDHSTDGQLRHAYRMLTLCREQKTENIIISMTCGLEQQREILNPDIIIWMDSKSPRVMQLAEHEFVPPSVYDAKFAQVGQHQIDEVVRRCLHKKL